MKQVINDNEKEYIVLSAEEVIKQIKEEKAQFVLKEEGDVISLLVLDKSSCKIMLVGINTLRSYADYDHTKMMQHYIDKQILFKIDTIGVL